jgi:non-heme chloroperoxidase
MPTITTNGASIFYKDWGTGRPVVLSHGWPLSADSWEAQMLFLASNGLRCIAHDRRGHGRSSQPWDGNDMDTYADDLAALIETLDLRGAVLVGFSTGGGEVARYIGRHGTERVAGVALVSAVPPLMLKADDNPGGVPIEVFDGLRAESIADRAQLYRDLADGPFFGNNRPGANVSQGTRDNFWLQGMQSGHRNAYECIAAFSATDFRGDLAKFDVPTLVVHGDDDQIVPFEVGGPASAALVEGAALRVYPGAPHGITDTHKDQLNADLLAFVQDAAAGATPSVMTNGGPPAKRILIITNEAVANPARVPDVVADQVRRADAVRVVAPALTSRLHSWVSDVDAEYREADERMRMLVSGIDASGPVVSGEIGDEDPLLAVADALVEFPADALILGVHASNDANWRERRFSKKVRERFGLPVTEVMLDRDGHVLSVTTE